MITRGVHSTCLSLQASWPRTENTGIYGRTAVEHKWKCETAETKYNTCPSLGNAGCFILFSLSSVSHSPLSFSLSISLSLCVHKQPTQQPCMLTLLCEITEKGPTRFHTHMCPESLWTEFFSGWEWETCKREKKKCVRAIKDRRKKEGGGVRMSEQRERDRQNHFQLQLTTGKWADAMCNLLWCSFTSQCRLLHQWQQRLQEWGGALLCNGKIFREWAPLQI